MAYINYPVPASENSYIVNSSSALPAIVASGRINSDGTIAHASTAVASCANTGTGLYTITLNGTYSANDGLYNFVANSTFLARTITHDGPYDSGGGVYVIDLELRDAAGALVNAYFDFVLVKV